MSQIQRFGGGGGAGTVTSVTGTTNQITATGTTSVVLSIPSTWIAPGSVEVTSGFTVDAGTITLSPLNSAGAVQTNASGVLSTGVLPATIGGTAQSTYTTGDILYASASNTLSKLSIGSAGYVLSVQAGIPAWEALSGVSVTSISGTTNQITVSPTTGAAIASLPAAVVAPGSLATTTTLASGTTLAAGNLTTAGIVYNSVTTGILTSHQATNHTIQIGNSSGQLGEVSVGATGTVLIGNTAADPSFSALSGLAVTSITGTANQITASASVGAVTLSTPATFIAPGSIAATTTVTATLGAITATSGNLISTAVTSSSVGNLLIGGVVALHMYGTQNIFLNGAGNYTLSGTQNSCTGPSSGLALTTGAQNQIYGYDSGAAITQGAYNCIYGAGSMNSLTTGSANVLLGSQMTGYTSSESSNILLGYGVAGTAAESNVCRIGSGTGTGTGNLNKVFISGTYATAVGATAGVALIDSSSQLGGLAGAVGTIFVGGTKPSWLTAGTSGYVLKAAGAGVAAAWTDLTTLAVTAIAGTTNQITASASVGSVTLSTPSTFIAPGTIEATTTITAGTNIVATAGNISTSSGNYFGTNNASNANGPKFSFQKIRGASTIVSASDAMGNVSYTGWDGTQYVEGAAIKSQVGGTPGTNRVAGDLEFYTHPDSTTGGTSATLRVTIASTGATTIAAPDSGVGLTISGGGLTVTGTTILNTALAVAYGGSGLTATTVGGIFLGSSTSAFTNLVIGTSGYVLTSNGTTAAWAAAAAGGLTWSTITADQTASTNNGYICNKASALVLTLPTSSAVGDILKVTGINTALGWKIAQAASQQIFFGTQSTTSGTGGSLQSSAIRDAIEIVCITANLTWQVLSSMGNITIV